MHRQVHAVNVLNVISESIVSLNTKHQMALEKGSKHTQHRIHAYIHFLMNINFRNKIKSNEWERRVYQQIRTLTFKCIYIHIPSNQK